MIANFCPQVFWVGRKVHFCKYFSQLQFTLCFPQSFMLLYEEGCFLKNQKSLQPICTCNFFWCARLNLPACACTNGQGILSQTECAASGPASMVRTRQGLNYYLIIICKKVVQAVSLGPAPLHVTINSGCFFVVLLFKGEENEEKMKENYV